MIALITATIVSAVISSYVGMFIWSVGVSNSPMEKFCIIITTVAVIAFLGIAVIHVLMQEVCTVCGKVVNSNLIRYRYYVATNTGMVLCCRCDSMADKLDNILGKMEENQCLE